MDRNLLLWWRLYAHWKMVAVGDDLLVSASLLLSRLLLLLWCKRNRLLRISFISHARKRANQVRQAKQVARARKTVSHCAVYDSLQLVPRTVIEEFEGNREKPYRTRRKEERQRAAVQRPYISMSSRTSGVKTPFFSCNVFVSVSECDLVSDFRGKG